MVYTKTVKIVNKYKPASKLKRFFAYLIDILTVNLIISIPFGDYLNKYGNNIGSLLLVEDKGLFAISIFTFIAVLLYFSYLEYKTSQTLGKMIMNIYTINTAEKELSFNQCLLRNITKPFPIILLVDVVYMIFKGANQRLFEVFSNTSVVQKEAVLK